MIIRNIIMILLVIFVWVDPIWYRIHTGHWFINPIVIFFFDILNTVLLAIALFAKPRQS